jgi:type I restriction-modification system DNA methylase subunit
MSRELRVPTLSKQAAKEFALKWRSAENEIRDYQSFWEDFFRHLCGVDDTKVAGIEFQFPVKSATSGNQNWIDVYWKNVAIIEHKSKGEDLDKAELQARGYLRSLAPGYRPRTLIISDFANFRIIDVKLNRTHEFKLDDLPENIHRFEHIISGSKPHALEEEITVDQEAAKLMANLYLELESNGYEGHETSVFLVRMLFLFFGDDTKMWEHNTVKQLLLNTKEDGSDVGKTISKLFTALNTSIKDRKTSVELSKFPYVNGGIFAEDIQEIDFNKKMRVALINAANYDWSTINPTIFGALFQLIKSKEERAALGEHYTSEENINKIIYPLFLESLQERLTDSWDSKKLLKELRRDLGKIRLLDPACGCGNFLVVAYRHLRQLELELLVRLQELEGKESDIGLDGSFGLQVGLQQLYGIEILDWPSQVARVALFLTDHQENLKLEKVTGSAYAKFPLLKSATILNKNALEIEWDTLFDFNLDTYVLGNPPFVGSLMLNLEQKLNQKVIWNNHPKSGIVDFVTNWFLLAAKYISKHGCQSAFVATSSIAQGEQPFILWSELNKFDVHISFAHSRFLWSNESSGMAAVACVIIGLSKKNESLKSLWSYPSPKSEAVLELVANINSYLISGPEMLVSSRSEPLSSELKTMYFGSMPRDNGHLSKISESEAKEIRSDNVASKYLRECVGADELLNGGQRYALWLEEASPAEISSSKILKARVAAVRKMRHESKAASTRKAADIAHLFVQRAQPKSSYIAVPGVSSENRMIIPMAYMPESTIATNALLTVADERLSTFAILQSKPFTIWASTVSGRLEGRIRISAEITYHNFPLPKISSTNRESLDMVGREILDARSAHLDSTLSELYSPGSTPLELLKLHDKCDKLVLAIFGLKSSASNQQILASLFEHYKELTTPTIL